MNRTKTKLRTLLNGILRIATLVIVFALLGWCQWRGEDITARVGNLVFAVICISLGLIQMKMGRMFYVDGNPWLTRHQKPIFFWLMNIVLLVNGVLLILQKVC